MATNTLSGLKKRCGDCRKSRPVEGIVSLSRKAGGNYRRPPRIYFRDVCRTCLIDLLQSMATFPFNSRVGDGYMPQRVLSAARSLAVRTDDDEIVVLIARCAQAKAEAKEGYIDHLLRLSRPWTGAVVVSPMEFTL